MNLKDLIVDLIDTNDGCTYLYLSGSEKNIEEVKTHVYSSCYPDESSVKVYLLHADAIGNIANIPFTEIFVDKGLHASAFKRIHVTRVDPETLEVE